MFKFRVLLLVSLFLPLSAFAADFSNVGIIPSNIWYSKFPFYADEQVRIYSALFNNSGYTLRGVIGFYDDQILLGKKSFLINSGENLHEIFYEWQASSGAHKIRVKVLSVEASKDGIAYETITLKNVVTGEQSLTVDVDPTKDQIAQLRQQLADLSLSQTQKALSGKFGEIIGAVKNVDLKASVGALDSAIDIGVNKTADIAHDSAAEVKAHLDSKNSIVLVPNAKSVNTSSTTSSVPLTTSAKGTGQLASLGVLDISWNYLKYFFFSMVALLFSSKWIFYISCIVILIICILKLRRK